MRRMRSKSAHKFMHWAIFAIIIFIIFLIWLVRQNDEQPAHLDCYEVMRNTDIGKKEKPVSEENPDKKKSPREYLRERRKQKKARQKKTATGKQSKKNKPSKEKKENIVISICEKAKKKDKRRGYGETGEIAYSFKEDSQKIFVTSPARDTDRYEANLLEEISKEEKKHPHRIRRENIESELDITLKPKESFGEAATKISQAEVILKEIDKTLKFFQTAKRPPYKEPDETQEVEVPPPNLSEKFRDKIDERIGAETPFSIQEIDKILEELQVPLPKETNQNSKTSVEVEYKSNVEKYPNKPQEKIEKSFEVWKKMLGL